MSTTQPDSRKAYDISFKLRVIELFQERRDKGVRVTENGLRREAPRLHTIHGNQSFKGSSSWYRKLKKRHNLSFWRVTYVAQKSREVIDEKVDRFLLNVLLHRRTTGYPDRCMGNLDETPVWLEMPGRSTLEHTGTNTVSVTTAGQEKKCITVILTALADGTKLPVFVLLPGVRPPPKQAVPAGVIIYMCGTGKSWANEASTVVYLNQVWGRNHTDRRLMVWDTFRGHCTERIKTLLRGEFNTDVVYIPGGCTSKLQPADVSWNKPFKNHLQDAYDEWMFSGEKTYTAAGNQRAPSTKQILGWVRVAWSKITPDIIRKSFKKTGISNAMDGTEDHHLDNSDDEADPFEGFDNDDVADAEEFGANVASALDNACFSEDSNPECSSDECESESDEDYISPKSPGH